MLDKGHTMPLVHFMARHKNQVIYSYIFNTLKQVEPDLNFVTVTTDSKRKVQSSISVFPEHTHL